MKIIKTKKKKQKRRRTCKAVKYFDAQGWLEIERHVIDCSKRLVQFRSNSSSVVVNDGEEETVEFEIERFLKRQMVVPQRLLFSVNLNLDSDMVVERKVTTTIGKG